MIYKIYFSVIFVLFLCFSNKSFTQTIPTNFATDSINSEVENNLNYLLKHAVFSTKGYTPFRIDNKWGLKASNCRIVLQPVYDSILNGGHDFFIVVKGGKYELLNKNFWSCLDGPMKHIDYDFKTKVYTVKDSKDSVSSYEPTWYSSLKLKKGVDHSRYLKPPDDADMNNPRTYPYTFRYFEGYPFADSIVTTTYSDSVRITRFYPIQGKSWSLQVRSFKAVADNYIITWDGELQYILDGRNGDTLFQFFDSFDFSNYYYFKSQMYYRMQYRNSENTAGSTTIFDKNMDTVCFVPGIFDFEEGFLYGYEFSEEGEHIYTFPDLKLVPVAFSRHKFLENFLLANPYGTEEYRLYYKEKLLKTFDYVDEAELIESHLFSAKFHLAVIKFRNEDQLYTEVYDSLGKLLWSGSDFHYIHYNPVMNQLSIDFQGENGELDFRTSVFDTISGEFRLTPFDRSKVDQIGANFFVCHDNDSISVFRDLKGNRLNKEEYTYTEVYDLNFHRFVSVHNANVAAVYKDDYELICDSCYIENFFNFIHGNWNQFTAIRSMKDPLHYKVYDEEGKTPLKKDYLAVYFHHLEDRSNGYFVALNDQYEMEYIPLSEIQ